LVLGVGLTDPSFLTLRSLRSLAAGTAVLLLLATGQTIAIISGRIDLSTAALASLATVLLAVWMPRAGLVAVVAVLALCILVGAIQGVLHWVAQMPSFVITIGGLFLFSGLSLIASGAKGIGVTEAQNVVGRLSGGEFTFGLPNSLLFALAALLGGAVILQLTAPGRWIRAMGVSERAAIMVGIRTPAVVVTIFALTGLFAGLAGLVLMADFSAGRPNLANSLLLPSIAAVVVGGTAITGGAGGLARTLVGAMIIQVMRVGVNVVGLPPEYNQVLYGVVVILAVVLTTDRSKLVVVK
jgi:ribose transport system permease protein